MPSKREPSCEGTNVPACATGRTHDGQKANAAQHRLDNYFMYELRRNRGSGIQIAIKQDRTADDRHYLEYEGGSIDVLRHEDARLDECIRHTEQQLAQMQNEAKHTSEHISELEQLRATLLQKCHYWQQKLEQCNSAFSGSTARSRLIAQVNSMVHKLEGIASSSSSSSVLEPILMYVNPSAAAAGATAVDASCYVNCGNAEQLLQQQLPTVDRSSGSWAVDCGSGSWAVDCSSSCWAQQAVDCSSDSWAVDYDAAAAVDTMAEKQQPLQKRFFSGFASFSSKLQRSCKNLFSRSNSSSNSSSDSSRERRTGLGWCSCVCKDSAV